MIYLHQRSFYYDLAMFSTAWLLQYSDLVNYFELKTSRNNTCVNISIWNLIITQLNKLHSVVVSLIIFALLLILLPVIQFDL